MFTQRLAPFLVLISITTSLCAQGYGLRTERVAADIGVVISATDTVDLTGYSTFRLYVTTAFPEDKIVSITGEGDHPGLVSTTGDFFQSAFGGSTPAAITPSLFSIAPSLAYDSWLTVGNDGPVNPTAGEEGVSILQAPESPWLLAFDAVDGSPGGDIILDGLFGGGWYVSPEATNSVAGPDREVLIGQFTTNGTLSGILLIQVLRQGVPSFVDPTADLRLYLPFEALTPGDPVGEGPSFCGEGTVWNENLGKCVETCTRDVDGDGTVTILDILEVLSFFESTCF